jgi:hypothetical protein
MGKHETIDASKDEAGAKAVPPDATRATLVPGDGADADSAMKNALAAIESLKVESPPAAIPTIESAAVETPKIESADTSAPKAEDLDEAGKSRASQAAPEPMMEDVLPHDRANRQLSPFALMAASLGGAAAFGAMIGALIATGIAKPTPVAALGGAKIGVEEINALKEQVVQARVELAALKTNIDSGHRNANQQFTKINERVERVERTQAEPVARLTKAVESLDRWERRADANAAKDTTGSITPPVSASPPQPSPVLGQPLKPPNLEGWVVREVRRGTAFLEGRMGIIEVDQGDIVPGLGRIESIRRQDGRWMVVTSKGVIPPAR